MFFLRGRRRKKLLATPLAPDARRVLHTAAPLCAALPAALRARHEGVVQVLLKEKQFEGAADLEVTDAMRLAVTGQAALLQLRPHADYFPGLDTILIYPDAFVAPGEEWDDDGLVHEDLDERAGESWQRGVVVLSWKDVDHESTRRDGYNVVLHEFAHQLDEQDGGADGTPLLPTADLTERWPAIFQAAFEKHRRSLRRRRHVLFDENAAESPSEFFATAVEIFFEYPRDMRREYGDIYTLLAEYLELDPARWTA